MPRTSKAKKGDGKKSQSEPRHQGRQNAFSGVKLELLESYKDQFLNSTDRGGFYTLAAKAFIQQFGYDLAIEDNPGPEGDNDKLTPEGVDPSLPLDQQILESDQRSKFYHELRDKLGCWYRYRYLTRSTNQSYVNGIIEHITSTGMARPRKKSTITMYGELNKDKIRATFDPLWEAIKASTMPSKRLQIWNEHVRACWEKETPEVRDKVVKQANEENKKATADWKKKASFTGSPEDLNQAWKTAEQVLPSFADAMSEWLGANIVILAVTPLGMSNGEIVLQSVQSDTSKGMTRKLLPKFDQEGWSRLQDMMLAYGRAYFSPEECSHRVVKDLDELKLTGLGKDVAADVHSSGDSSLRSKCEQVSQPIDKPVNKVPANVQHPVRDNGRQTDEVLQVHEQMSSGDLDAPSNEPTPLLHGFTSGISNSGPGLLSTTPLYTFNALMGSFDDQSSDQGFGNSADIDWSTLQGPDGLQVQGNVPLDLWFNGILGSLSAIQSAPTDNSSSLLPGPLPNGDTQELYLPAMGVYSSPHLPQEVVPTGDVNPPPSTPLPGAIDPHIVPPLASIPTQECPPHVPSPSIQLPTDPSLGSLDGKDNQAAAVGRRGANKRGGARKRKADNTLVGMKDSGASEPRKKHAKHTGELAEEEATEATTEEEEADRLAKEAKAAQEVAIEAAKAAKAAAKAAKEAKEAAKPEQARRSARVHTLPDHLKGVGYAPPKRNSRANSKST